MEWQRRSRTRVPVCYPVQLHSDDNMAAGMLLNLSPSGCQVRSSLALEPGTYVAVHISVPHHLQPVAVELSIVRWQRNGHCGLEFLRYGQGQRDRLIHLTGGTSGNHRPHVAVHEEDYAFATEPENTTLATGVAQ
ncbi:hypothetical protein YTPLAS18_26740 [Nitrospira sp.]|nr:hypothetical protein YTPLAS18_26740 [Nitrospira sp.]